MFDILTEELNKTLKGKRFVYISPYGDEIEGRVLDAGFGTKMKDITLNSGMQPYITFRSENLNSYSLDKDRIYFYDDSTIK